MAFYAIATTLVCVCVVFFFFDICWKNEKFSTSIDKLCVKFSMTFYTIVLHLILLFSFYFLPRFHIQGYMTFVVSHLSKTCLLMKIMSIWRHHA